MSDHSSIEWTDSTWNPVTGCSKVSQGCKHCYALREWPRLSAPRPRPNIYTGRQFTDVAEHMDRLEQPLHWHKPRRIFVNSMSDLFHEAVSDRFISNVFGIMAAAHWHQFQVLTKRADRMRDLLTRPDFLPMVEEAAALYTRNEVTWPVPNLWLCVSAEDQATADARVVQLSHTPAAVRGVSAEPLLGPIDLRRIVLHSGPIDLLPTAPPEWRAVQTVNVVMDATVPGKKSGRRAIDWVVVGGESGPNARPMHPDWARSLRDQCATAGVAFFFKQWGEWAPNCLCDTKHAHPPTPRPTPGKLGCMFRCGKHAAGRLLDGRTHDEFPNPSTAGHAGI